MARERSSAAGSRLRWPARCASTWRSVSTTKPRLTRSPRRPASRPMPKAPAYHSGLSTARRGRPVRPAAAASRPGGRFPRARPGPSRWRSASRARGQRLRLVQRLRADLAHVVDPHQRAGQAALARRPVPASGRRPAGLGRAACTAPEHGAQGVIQRSRADDRSAFIAAPRIPHRDDVRLRAARHVVARQQSQAFCGRSLGKPAGGSGAIRTTSDEEVGLISPSPGDLTDRDLLFNLGDSCNEKISARPGSADGVCGCASAQSSVTLFGVVDRRHRYTDDNDAGAVPAGDRRQCQQPPRLPWRRRSRRWPDGRLLARRLVAADTGTSLWPASTAARNSASIFQRRSTVSLMGGCGEVRLGRDYTPTFWNWTVFDPFGTNGVGAPTNLGLASAGLAPGGFYGTLVRANNTIGYFLPAMGGLYGQIMQSAGENVTGNKITACPPRLCRWPVQRRRRLGHDGSHACRRWRQLEYRGFVQHRLRHVRRLLRHARSGLAGTGATGSSATSCRSVPSR